MRRIFPTLLLVSLLILCSCEQVPIYNNTATTTTNFFIFDQGIAIVDVRYMGYQDQTVGADISVTIDVLDDHDIWRPMISEEYTADGYYHANQYQYQVERLGTYRLTVRYLVSGKDATTDTIVVEKMYTISQGINCPRGGATAFCLYEPTDDCTAPIVCRRCGQSPADMKYTTHIMRGIIVDRDETYHYRQCYHTTALGQQCTVYREEKHEYSGDSKVCLVCGYHPEIKNPNENKGETT